MSLPYEELVEGTTMLRPAPPPRHEMVCARLHAVMRAGVANFAGTRLLDARAKIRVNRLNEFRPDLALVTAASEKLWLAVEIVSSEDHQWDTVAKKQVYEEARVPRLWMVDPRYDNVEVYHATEFGLALKTILAGRDVLTEKLLPEFQFVVAELFAAQ